MAEVQEENLDQSLDNLPEISSEDELLNYIGGGEKPSEFEEETEEEKAAREEKENEERQKLENLIKPPDTSGAGGEESKEEKKEPDTDKEYNNIVEFLNEEYDLGFNKDQAKSLTREEEAEAVKNIYDGVLRESTLKLQEYQRIEEILKDKEVASFLEAKRDGKTMKDFVIEYGGETIGKSNEELVKDDLKRQYSNMSDDDIKDMVDSLKERNKLDPLATQIRERAIKESESEKEIRAQNEKKQAEEMERQRIEEVQDFTKYVNGINAVHGIPIDQKMRDQAIAAITHLDNEGKTWFEKALQSNAGSLLAAMGLLHMDKLIKNSETVAKNKTRHNIMDKLTSDPKELQSSSNVEETEGFDVDAANSF